LYKIYNLKCVYCEDTLLNVPKHIEHYRPKDIYYWLAYSWDNLFLCCTSCNGSKGVNFEVKNQKISYTNETYKDIHSLGDNYDILEKPMLINPEKEDVLKDLIFDNKAQIFSNNDRVSYTLDICNIRRDELRGLREEILTDFVNSIEKHYNIFKIKKDLTRFEPDIESFIENCHKGNKFYSFRYFILNNPEVFFKKIPIQNIVKTIIKKLSKNEK
ncbi:MAG: HNH endonuclease, partial [Campylobacterota bacterium]|nr:HNH endonuclease [Campylobacterota bacterium]